MGSTVLIHYWGLRNEHLIGLSGEVMSFSTPRAGILVDEGARERQLLLSILDFASFPQSLPFSFILVSAFKSSPLPSTHVFSCFC